MKTPLSLRRARGVFIAAATLATLLIGQSASAAELYFDGNGATAGTGGSGLWTTANHFRSGSDAGALTTWADGNNAHFLGSSAGLVTISNGTTVTPVTSSFELTGYTVSSTSTSVTTLGGNIVLSASVNLTLNDATATTDRALAIGSVTGGTGSTLTISGNQSSGNNSRVLLSQANASIGVPITISNGNAGAFAGFVATNTGTGITGTIANSSNFTTLLGATLGNDLTLSSTAVISGSAGLLIGVTNASANVGTVTLNVANTYLGGTTLTGGTLALGDNSALGNGGTLTISTGASTTRSNSASAFSLSNAVTVTSTSTVTFGSSTTGNLGFGTLTFTADRTIDVENSATTFSSMVSNTGGTARALTKLGPGAMLITGNRTDGGITTITGGTFGVAGTFSSQNIHLDGGVLALNGSFTRSLGTTGNSTTQVQWTNSGGFAAYGPNATWGNAANNLTVNIGGAAATLTWGSTAQFLGTGQTLILGSTASNGTVDFQNGLNFGASVQTIQVDRGATAPTGGIDAQISGAIGSSGGGLLKTGAGTLALGNNDTNANSYTGLTTVTAGELDLNKANGTIAIAGDGGSMAQLATDDVLVNGGTLRWLHDEQVATTATINMTSGMVDLNGHTETLGTFKNSGGTFVTGTGTLIGMTASIDWSGTSINTINAGGTVKDGHISISDSTSSNTVEAGGLLWLLSSNPSTGLQMTGATLTLKANNSTPGTLRVDMSDITSFASSTTSAIVTDGPGANPGRVDLFGGSTHTITIADGAAAVDLRISASITNGGFTKAGAGTLELSGNNDYAGGTTLSAGTILINSTTAIGTGSFTISGAGTAIDNTSGSAITLANNNPFSLSGGNLTFTGTNDLNLGTGNMTLSGAASRTISVTNSTATLTVGGNISGSGVDLIKAGAGTLWLQGTTDTYANTMINAGTLKASVGSLVNTSGNITVNSGGTLLLDGNGRHIGANTPVILNGGTFNTGGFSEPGSGNGGAASNAIGALTLTATSTIDFGNGASLLQFAGVGTHTVGAILQMINWSGNIGTGQGTDQLLFNGLATTFTAAYQQNEVSFNGQLGYTTLQFLDPMSNPYFEVLGLTVIPEPGTWAAGALVVASLLLSQRRTRSRAGGGGMTAPRSWAASRPRSWKFEARSSAAKR